MTPLVLHSIGQFSDAQVVLFEKHVTTRYLNKNDLLLKEREVCRSVFYILSGSFYQFQTGEVEDTIVDLHVQNDWMFNHTSLIDQTPSKTSIRAFTGSEVIEFTLSGLHELIVRSPAFLQFGRIFDQTKMRTYLFDNSLNPSQKYNYLKETKPLILQIFPVKMIASFLKIAPETLSRVRAQY